MAIQLSSRLAIYHDKYRFTFSIEAVSKALFNDYQSP